MSKHSGGGEVALLSPEGCFVVSIGVNGHDGFESTVSRHSTAKTRSMCRMIVWYDRMYITSKYILCNIDHHDVLVDVSVAQRTTASTPNEEKK